MVADIFGYYLLLLPAALFLHRWLRPRRPSMADLATRASVAYMLLGTIGATILWKAWPTMIHSYSGASQAQQESLVLLFQTLSAVVEDGIWTIGGGLGGVWWLGIGSLLRHERRVLGLVQWYWACS